MISSRIVFSLADVDEPARSVRKAFGVDDAGWDIFVLNGRARRFAASGAAGFSIKWMAEGRARYEVDRRPRTVSRDAVMLVDQDQPYDMEFDTRTGAQSFCLFFGEGLVREAWASQEAGFDGPCGDGVLRGFPSLTFRPSPALAAQLAALAADGVDACEAALEARCLLALSQAIAAAHEHRRLGALTHAAKPATRAHRLAALERAKDHILQGAGVRLDLAALAREAGLSRFHLLRLFKAVYGQTPMAFAEEVRVARAAQALRSCDRPVGEIAVEAGYESPSAFAKAFRRRRGVGPTDWRISNRGRACDDRDR